MADEMDDLRNADEMDDVAGLDAATSDLDLNTEPLPDNVWEFPKQELVDYRVAYGDRTFEITEPDLQTVLRLLNVLGELGLRAERVVGANFKGLFQQALANGSAQSAIPFEATLFALLATLDVKD